MPVHAPDDAAACGKGNKPLFTPVLEPEPCPSAGFAISLMRQLKN
jgi:hypothetical protein